MGLQGLGVQDSGIGTGLFVQVFSQPLVGGFFWQDAPDSWVWGLEGRRPRHIRPRSSKGSGLAFTEGTMLRVLTSLTGGGGNGRGGSAGTCSYHLSFRR